MKKIEERLNEISIEIGNNCADFYSHEIDFTVIKDGLRQIATEQREIDAREMNFMSKRIVDKAWNYFKDMIESWCLEVGADPNVYLPQEEEKFRKAMEEKEKLEILEEVALVNNPEEIKQRYWRRFMHKAKKCVKQAWAMRDSFAGNDEDFVNYFNELMEE